MDSQGYIRLKVDASISSKGFYKIYLLRCEENSLTPLKARSFSDAMVTNAKKFHLEHTNKIINFAGRRVWGFIGVESVFQPDNNGFYDVSQCTYRKNGEIEIRFELVRMYVAFFHYFHCNRNGRKCEKG